MTTDPEERPTGASIVERVPLVPIGSRRVEATLATMVSVFGLLFAALTLPVAVAQLRAGGGGLGVLVAVLVYGLIGTGQAIGFAILRYRRIRFPDVGSYPGALLNTTVTFEELALATHVVVASSFRPWPASMAPRFCGPSAERSAVLW